MYIIDYFVIFQNLIKKHQCRYFSRYFLRIKPIIFLLILIFSLLHQDNLGLTHI